MAPPPSLHPPRSHLFTPIQEGNESEETEAERQRFRESTAAAVTLTPASSTSTDATTSTTHQATPLHEPGKKTRRRESPSESATVSCNNCRPTTRGGEKHSVTVVPVDAARNSHHSLSSTPSPTAGLFKSLISNLSRRSPKPSPSPPPPPPPLPISCAQPDREDQWRAAVAELSHKLVQATRKRDEAIVESSKLKYSMGELEKKLNRLEVYCHTLKSGLEKCHGSNLVHSPPSTTTMMVTNSVVNVDKLCDGVVIKSFLVSVSEARSSIRFLSRALTPQLKLMGSKVFDRICTILRSYDIKLTSSYCSNNPRGLQFYLEALLSATFYEDFESVGFSKNSVNRVLNPIDRAELNFGAFKDLKELAWEEVLNKGTKHFSEEFSRFCDRKMSEIVAMLGWSRAWPEQLLQAFFGASKRVWLVHLLANSVHPSLTIFRVEKGARFDPVYMEDMGGDKAKKLIPTVVRIMVAPGFYVYDNVVKCKVVCRYYNSNYSELSSANDM